MFSYLSRFLLKVLGWKITGLFPEEVKKLIVVVVPHTSNWDFPLGILVRNSIKKDIKFLAKSSLFKPAYGWLFKALGGYPVDRSRSTNTVDAVKEIFDRHEVFRIAIAPEGTRKKVDRLKTGFYYMALAAEVPILLTKFDYKNKEVNFGLLYYPTGDKDRDFEVIHNFFQGTQGKRPERSFLLDR